MPTTHQQKALTLLEHHEDKNITLGLRLLESWNSKDAGWALRNHLGPDETSHKAHKKLFFLLKEIDDGLSVEIPTKWKKLQKLYLGAKEIHHLPKSIAKLARLKKLYLWGNKLTTLPDCIGELKQLEVLHLGCNQLHGLSDNLGKLKNLQHLYLWANQLSELPPVIRQLTSLQTLHL